MAGVSNGRNSDSNHVMPILSNYRKQTDNPSDMSLLEYWPLQAAFKEKFKRGRGEEEEGEGGINLEGYG